MTKTLALISLSLTLALLGACHSSSSPEDMRPTDANTTDGSRCCPVLGVDCDCGGSVGGARLPNGTCPGGSCDAPSSAFELSTDDAGCPVLVLVDDEASCFPRPDLLMPDAMDAGADAMDAGATDSATDAALPNG